MAKEIFSPATLPPPTGYSHIAKVSKGTLVYVAGQVSSDASGKLVGEALEDNARQGRTIDRFLDELESGASKAEATR